MCKGLIFLMAFCLLSFLGFGQNQLQVNGQAAIYHDNYSIRNFGNSDFNPRRPNNFTRFVITPYFSAKDFDMPVHLIFALQQTNTLTPQTSQQNFKDFLLNPANQISIAPRYKWARLSVGRIFPMYSEFTTGNQSIFGFGLELRPKKFIVDLSYGLSQRAVATDSTNFIQGAFERRNLNFRVGWGNLDKGYFNISSAYANDIAASADVESDNLKPEEGLTLAPAFAIQLGKSLRWKNEVALGVHTKDKTNAFALDEFETETLSASPIRINASTRYDYAATSSLEFNKQYWGLSSKAMYVGPNFQTYGYPFFQNDRIDLTLNPRFNSKNNKMFFTGQAGYRLNNIAETKSQTTKQLLLSANLNTSLSDKLNLSLNYANFGLENDFSSDSLKIRNVSSNYGISPSFQTSTEKLYHNISATINYNQFEEFNAVSTQKLSQETFNSSLNYSISYIKIPLLFWAGIANFKNSSQLSSFDINSLLLGVGYKLFKNSLSLKLSTDIVSTNRKAFTNDLKLGGKIKINYRYKNKYQLGLNISNSRYEYGSIKPNSNFSEWFVQTALIKNF